MAGAEASAGRPVSARYKLQSHKLHSRPRPPKIARSMTQTLAAPVSLATRWSQFYALTKPRVVQLIVFCALIGMLLAQPGLPDVGLAGAATLGIWLVASAAAAFNCLVEQQIDRRKLPNLAGHHQNQFLYPG